MNPSLPVIFLAFANEYHEGRYLHKLVEEYKQLHAALGQVASNEGAARGQNALCELVIRQNVTIGEIFDVFQKYEGRIAIFHYGGHADGYQLLLQGKDGAGKIARGGGLVSLLSRRKSLRLVFLNGCSTQRLARDLTKRGVPAVIGTSVSIPDDVALLLAARFYKGLSSGLTLAGAWEQAKAEVATTGGSSSQVQRGIAIDLDEQGSGFDLDKGEHFPWDVEFRDGASKEIFDNWNLPGAASQPLFGLPEPRKQNLPPSPFLFLRPYGMEQAEIFFGRSYYIRDLYLKIIEPNSPPIILLYGESGAGKSSLLDAGLLPRLAAAADPETGEPLFDVRYQRRDQDLGLISSLAAMLSHFILVEETEAEAPQQDPNLEKIQAIESLAKELDAPAASSFLSLVERYKAMRAIQSPKSFQENPYYRSGDLDIHAGVHLREAWLAIEKQSGRRLVLILDQVEELFTRPNPKMERELEDLLQVLYDIFGTPAEDPAQRVRGKIVLGYREEFNAKIDARFKEIGLSRSTVFLEQLNKKDILDIFRGLQSGVVKDHYNIAIEPGLPDHVANQLLMGRESVNPNQRPVAPVLQLLLTKLWNKAYRENPHQPAFTIDTFNEVESQGREMEAYFDAQMQKVQGWRADLVESGLALDVLEYHITDLGTSRRCSMDELCRRYHHLAAEYPDEPDLLEQLVNQLKSPEIFLLNDIGRGYTSLPHDTLAPVIRRKYNRSRKLGQRSARILDAKRFDFVMALRAGEEKKVRLDDNDLEVVTGGIRGMRALEDTEKKLYQISAEEREKRLKLRRILVRSGIMTGLLMLVLAILASVLTVSVFEQLRDGVVERAHLASLKQAANEGLSGASLVPAQEDEEIEAKDKESLLLAQFAYSAKGKDRRVDVAQNYFQLAKLPKPDGRPPFELLLQPGLHLDTLHYDPRHGPLALLGRGSRLAYWPASRNYAQKTIDLADTLQDQAGSAGRDPQAKVERFASYTANGQGIQLVQRGNLRPLYEMNGQLVSALMVEIFDDPFLGDRELATSLGHYDLFSGEFVGEHGARLSQEAFSRANRDKPWYVGRRRIEVDELVSIQLMDAGRMVFLDSVYQELKQRGWPLADSTRLDRIVRAAKLADSAAPISLRRSKNLARGANNHCLVWEVGADGTAEASGVFSSGEPLDYLYALTKDSFLTISPEGELAIRDGQGDILDSLLAPTAGVIDVALSPDGRHIFALTRDSALLWKLDGTRAGGYLHPNVRGYAFSADGARLFTQSPLKIRFWSADNRPLKEYRTADTAQYRIVSARFQDSQEHLAIGLAPRESVASQGIFARISNPRAKKARIESWHIIRESVVQDFEVPYGQLFDASVSSDGNLAVALTEGQAQVIPASRLNIRRWDYNHKGIRAALAKGKDEASQRLTLSPSGRYIVRHSPGDNRVELFNRRGRLVNAYRYGQYTPGFQGALLTPDDYYLIASKADEVFFWHSEDANIPWPQIEGLSLAEKQAYELTTPFDFIPGQQDNAKWWALSLLLIALLHSLLFFSGSIIGFVQRRDYLSFGLYGASFLILTALLLGAWLAGGEDMALKKIAFYGLLLANLSVLSYEILQAIKKRKYRYLALAGIIGLLLTFGLVRFVLLESAHVDVFEWAILKALLLLAVFGGLAVYPIFRAIKAYRADNRRAFYHWLLLPSGFTSLACWGGFAFFTDDYYFYGETTLEWLNILAGLGVAGAVIYQSIRLIQSRRLGALLTYAVPTFLVVIVLKSLAQLQVIALVAAFIYGWQAYGRGAWKRAFFFFSAAIFLLAGMLAHAYLSGDYPLLQWSLLLAPLLIVVFYALRQQLGRLSQRKAAGKLRLLNWVAIFGLWWVAFIAVGWYSVYRPDASYEAFETAYPEPESGQLLSSVMARYRVWQSEEGDYDAQSTFFTSEDGYYFEIKNNRLFAEFVRRDSTAEYVELFDPEYQIELRLYAAKAEYRYQGDTALIEQFAGQWIEPPQPLEEPGEDEAEQNKAAEPSAELQRLIRNLFSSENSVREEARRQLSSRADPALIPALIQYSRENPVRDEGLWQALYLLADQPDERLLPHREAVLDFLDWMAQKGYGEMTMRRIEGLQERLGRVD
jgi:hypothetical protein